MIKGSHHSLSTRQRMRGPRPHRRGPRRDPRERFEESVDRNGPVIRPELGPCHIWTGKRRRGKCHYGLFFHRGRWVHAHRFILEQAKGPLPAGQCALHRCDNPPCVREDHLFAGTQGDNVLDMCAKGRNVPVRGERQPGAKLTYELADLIRFMHRIAGVGIKMLSVWYEVGETTIANVVHDRTWVPLAA